MEGQTTDGLTSATITVDLLPLRRASYNSDVSDEAIAQESSRTAAQKRIQIIAAGRGGFIAGGCRNIADRRTMRYCARYHWKHLSHAVAVPSSSPFFPSRTVSTLALAARLTNVPVVVDSVGCV